MTLLPTSPSRRPGLLSRPKKLRRTPEQDLQRQIAQFLAIGLAGNSWWSTIPLGGGGKVRGAILRGMGAKKGMPDLLIINDGKAIWIEVKSYTGAVSEAQKRCHTELRRARCSVYVVRSLDDVIAALTECGVPMRASAP